MTTLQLAWMCLVAGAAFGVGLVLGAGLCSGALAVCTKKGRAELSKKHQEIVDNAKRQISESTRSAIDLLARQQATHPLYAVDPSTGVATAVVPPTAQAKKIHEVTDDAGNVYVVPE